MKAEQIKLRGWSVPIWEAVQAAGGPVEVAAAMGFKTEQTPRLWIRNKRMPKSYVPGLCALGGNKIKPEEIFNEMARGKE